MNLFRYQTREQIEIDAPIERVYAVAADPELVSSYAPEIDRIEVVKSLTEHSVMVRSYLKVAGLTVAFRYRNHYHAPTRYSGVQERGKFLRGYFNFFLKAQGSRTTVFHTEGILSAIPCLAWIAGFIYFRVLARRGMVEELGRLKELVEARRDEPRPNHLQIIESVITGEGAFPA